MRPTTAGKRGEEMKEGDFYYTTDYGEKVYLTDAQAEEVFRQKEAYYKAEDLLQTIEDEFADNEQLKSLTVNDLLKYVDDLEHYTEMCISMDGYWECCKTIIEDVVTKDLEGKDE